jgi:hypothetical protein
MSDNTQYDFFLLRYAPDALKNEFVNIGVVLLGENGYAKVRMTRDWRRVLCMDADADLELFAALGRDLQSQLANLDTRAATMKRITESFSGAIQLSAMHACMTDQPGQQVEDLAKFYVDTRRAAAKRDLTGRQRILRIMQDEFERAAVWSLMNHQIPVAEYTFPGDPLKIDCAYRTNGSLKMFHAVPLTTGVDLARTLAFTYPMLVRGMQQKQNVAAHLTAIVDTLDRERAEVGFALQALESTGMALSLVEEMPAIAERARQDLRA